MCVHLVVAFRTVDPAIQVFPVRRMRTTSGCLTARSKVLNDCHEYVHGDQRAVAMITVENPFASAGCVHQRNCTHWTGQRGRLIQHPNALGIGLGIVDIAAIIANQALFVCF